ncbi:hypothetical protein Angca_000873, partial [Angiostrongylus cantonensis]
IRITVCVGILVILSLFTMLYLKFRKAIFLLLIPTIVTAATVAAIAARRHHLVWPLIATSVSPLVNSCCYSLIARATYTVSISKLVSNEIFSAQHTDKTESYYIHCSTIFAALIIFLVYNSWQAAISVSYLEYLRMQQQTTLTNKPTVLIVNK